MEESNMAVDFLKLAEQNLLTFDDEHEHYYVKPIDRHNFITFPLEDLGGTVMVTIDEYLGLRANYYQFTEDLKGIELYELPPVFAQEDDNSTLNKD